MYLRDTKYHMRIIHLVLGKANPERMNGVNKVAHNLATTQTNLGHDVTLWGITRNHVKNWPERNYKTRLFKHVDNKFRVDSDFKTAVAELPDKEVAVHIHGSFITEFYHIAKILKQHQVPFTYTAHGALGPNAMKRNALVKKIYFTFFEQYILKNAKVVHLLGKSEEDNVAQLLPKLTNVHTIPNGQNLEAIPKIEVDKTNRQQPIFGFLGRLDKNHKGLDLMLDGFALYMKNGGTGTLELVGNGADMDFLQNKATELNIKDKVTFHGAKYGDEKFDYVANFDVFLHTSRMEGFPTAVLEAAALGLPCITSEATNINDYIRKYDAGYALLENTPTCIGDTMLTAEKAMKDKSLDVKGANALKMVHSEFTWEKVAEALVEIY